jgi:hypothetical protein
MNVPRASQEEIVPQGSTRFCSGIQNPRTQYHTVRSPREWGPIYSIGHAPRRQNRSAKPLSKIFHHGAGLLQ